MTSKPRAVRFPPNICRRDKFLSGEDTSHSPWRCVFIASPGLDTATEITYKCRNELVTTRDDRTLETGYLCLRAAMQEHPDTWEQLASMPDDLGEAARFRPMPPAEEHTRPNV